MTKLSRVAFSLAAAGLMSLALATTPAEAACRPTSVITSTEMECASFCHDVRGCNYHYDADLQICTCSST